jgi:hypothetical protein
MLMLAFPIATLFLRRALNFRLPIEFFIHKLTESTVFNKPPLIATGLFVYMPPRSNLCTCLLVIGLNSY